MYYEITIKVVRTQEDGAEKEVTERFITDCELFAEAEAKGKVQMAMTNADGDVVAVKRSNIREIVNEAEKFGNYYRATIVDVFTDDAGKTKELRYYVLIRANDLDEATHKAGEYMQQGLQNMRLDGLTMTKILEVL